MMNFYEKLSNCVEISAVKTRLLLVWEETNEGNLVIGQGTCHMLRNEQCFVSLTIAEAILPKLQKEYDDSDEN